MPAKILKVADLKKIVRDVPDFPKPGIIFKDITTILQHPGALKSVVDTIAAGRGLGDRRRGCGRSRDE